MKAAAWIMLGAAALGWCGLASAPVQARPGDVAASALKAVDGGVEVALPGGVLRVTAVSDRIVRVRFARGGVFPDNASWAVLPQMLTARAAVTPSADGFTTGAVRVRIGAGGAVTLADLSGKVIAADAGPAVTLDGKGFSLRKAMPQDEHYFGLGDKTGGLDRRGQSFVDWNTDAFGFDRATDPIYKSIPFFVATGGAGGSYGLFLDNTWRSWFDFGHRTDGVLEMGAPDGPIDYYLIAGPSTAEVVRQFTDLVGKAPLPPLWALGYQQSRYSYMTADELRDVAAKLRADRIPTDVLWLDIDYQDRNRPFTVNDHSFPDLKGLIGDLGDQGFKVITITDLHIAKAPDQGYAPYDSGMAGDHFLHRADGSVYVAPVWPGDSVFPDFTQTKTRDWWGRLFARQVDQGVAGVWNDMNEPAIFNTPTKTMPDDVVHRIDGDGFTPRLGSHAEIHNVYGMQNARATYDGLRLLRPDARAFVMTRASYAGGQRYAMTWTGDNLATWDHLKLSVQQIINLGLSGFSWSAADVSGFAGGPSADLLTRWFEIGAFYPVFRDHSAKGQPRVEPWVDGPEHLAIRRRFVEERYRLMPYLYALADRNARTGDPVLRPVFYDYPSAARMPCDQSWTFTLGRALLVAPPPKPESPQDYDVCLPAGGWYDYWTGLPVGAHAASRDKPILSASQATGQMDGKGDVVTVTPKLDSLPVYVRAGTILPRQPLVQSTAIVPDGPLKLDVYPGADCAGDLYADDGHSMAFEKGDYFRQALSCRVTGDGIEIRFAKPQGRFVPWWKSVEVVVHGWDGTGTGTVRAQGRRIAGRTDAEARTLTFTMAAPESEAVAVITRR